MRAVLCMLLLLTCAAPSGPCSPATCNGCCDGTGRCVTGDSDQGCGRSGTTCDVCGAARFCENAVCVTRCTSDNCGGCCDEAGTCKPGDALGACGFGGVMCADCTSFASTCFFGICGGGGPGGGGGGGSAGGGAAGGSSSTGGGSGGGGGGSAGGSGGGSVVDGGLGARAFRVFVTAQTYLPDFGGANVGDRLCELASRDAGYSAGKVMAWLSAQDAGPLTRFPKDLDAHWDLPSGMTAFNNAGQLLTTPNVALNRDERGNLLTQGTAWTGTVLGARPAEACGNWAAISATGVFGSVISAPNWTQGGVPALCTTQRHLYCFQVQ